MMSPNVNAGLSLAVIRGMLTAAFVAEAVITTSVASAQATSDRPDVVIDSGAVREAVNNLAKETEANYPIAALATRTANELRARLRSGRYRLTSARALAASLTADLRALTGDQHFMVDYFVVPRVFPPATATPDPVSEADRHLTLKLQNFGFARVERLSGNVGYLKLDKFEMPLLAGETAAAAMRFISGTDALIIDLRDNGGGYSSMATLFSSYFFAEPVHLSDRTGRNPEDLKQNWTYAFVSGHRYLDKPVYILSGPRTFSAAEAFAYDLQSRKVAKVVGETTRGGANVAARLLLSSRFGVVMPTGVVKNTVTGGNWKAGLQPDVVTTAADALRTAHLAALEATAPKHRDDPLTAEIAKSLTSLRSEAAVTPPK